MDNINSSVACTSDIWEDRIKTRYLDVTTHFIDENQILQKRLIGFRQIFYPRTVENIFTLIIETEKTNTLSPM